MGMEFREFAEQSIALIHEDRVENDYLKEVERLFDKYIELNKQLDKPVIARKEFADGRKMNWGNPPVSICSNIISILEEFLNGRSAAANVYLHKTFFDQDSIFGGHVSSVMLDLARESILIRARTKTNGAPFDKTDLFHIPFAKRHLVQNLRFSISGLPALYFGSDSYTCWEELNRPEFSKVAFCGYKLKKPIQLIDLRIPPLQDVYSEDEQVSFIVRFPLILAMTRKVVNKDAPLKPEYILSQLFSQVTQELAHEEQKAFKGIAFSSSKIDYTKNSPSNFYNLFIPTFYEREKAHSSIIDSFFNVSNPVEWEVLQSIREYVIPILAKNSLLYAAPLLGKKKLNIDAHENISYKTTRWGVIDEEIQKSFKR